MHRYYVLKKKHSAYLIAYIPQIETYIRNKTDIMIKISKIIHRNQERVKIDFPYKQSIASQIKKNADAKWSQTHRAWHIPYLSFQKKKKKSK